MYQCEFLIEGHDKNTTSTTLPCKDLQHLNCLITFLKRTFSHHSDFQKKKNPQTNEVKTVFMLSNIIPTY